MNTAALLNASSVDSGITFLEKNFFRPVSGVKVAMITKEVHYEVHYEALYQR